MMNGYDNKEKVLEEDLDSSSDLVNIVIHVLQILVAILIYDYTIIVEIIVRVNKAFYHFILKRMIDIDGIEANNNEVERIDF